MGDQVYVHRAWVSLGNTKMPVGHELILRLRLFSGFRTDWSGRSMDFGHISHPAYAHVDPRKLAQARDGNQPGGKSSGRIMLVRLLTNL